MGRGDCSNLTQARSCCCCVFCCFCSLSYHGLDGIATTSNPSLDQGFLSFRGVPLDGSNYFSNKHIYIYIYIWPKRGVWFPVFSCVLQAEQRGNLFPLKRISLSTWLPAGKPLPPKHALLGREHPQDRAPSDLTLQKARRSQVVAGPLASFPLLRMGQMAPEW